MKNLVFILLISFYVFNSYGQGKDSIDSAVVELKRAEYNISSLTKTTLLYKYRVKILRAQGERFGNIEIPFGNHTRLKDFKGNLFDSNGKVIRKILKSELFTVSDFDDYSLYSDSKVKRANIRYFNYPYFVEYEYELEYNYFLGCYWTLLDDYGIASKSVQLVIKSPKDLEIGFRTNKFCGTHDRFIQGNTKVNSWSCQNVNSIPREDFSEGIIDLFPSIVISPKQFCYEGYCGTNDTWENYGKWVWNLLDNRNILPVETILKVHQLTDPVNDTIAKIKSIYRYFQSNTRYVSIQKGIGGFQAVSASTVDKCKYGDCKALSNYLKSLLSVIGVDAIYTEIGNGKDRRIKWSDFPSVYQTNHVILAIPLHGDTIWLECTNNHIPFGYIGSSNCNRKAVCINQTGGKIVNTPDFGSTENYQTTKAIILLDKNGNMRCNATYKESGILMDDLILLKNSDRKNQQKVLIDRYPSVNLEIEDFKISETNDVFPKMLLDIQMNERSFMSRTDRFYTFKPNYLNIFCNAQKFNEKRFNDIWLENSYTMSDTIRFILPINFKPEYIPKGEVIETIFGKYQVEYHSAKNELVYIRNFMFFNGTYSKDKNAELIDFLNNLQIADIQKVIFKEE